MVNNVESNSIFSGITINYKSNKKALEAGEELDQRERKYLFVFRKKIYEVYYDKINISMNN